MTTRMTILWPVGADGHLVGEDSYAAGAGEPLRKLEPHEIALVPSPAELKERLAGR